MKEERDFVQDLHSHLEEREWSDVQIVNLLHKIGRNALLSAQSTLEILEYQQAIDEQIEAEKEVDRWAIAGEFITQLPLSFYEDAEQHREELEHKDDAGMDNPPKWDSTGKWLGDISERDEH